MKTMLCRVLKSNTVVTSLPDIVDNLTSIGEQTKKSTARYVCVFNVHMCMEAFDDAGFAEIVNNADYVVADGRPIVWAQKMLGHHNAEQVRGMNLMLALCEQSQKRNLNIGLFGGIESHNEKLVHTLKNRYPGLSIVVTISPPFRALTDGEEAQYVEEINASDVDILFVALGCPKQEIWMAQHREKLSCTMVGVGAAFDFIAGNKSDAPAVVQKIGLEWLFRLIDEPKRLWYRYLYHNPRFLWYFARQLLGKNF